MEKLVSPVLLLKNGTELSVLIDVIQEKSGMLVHKLVYVHQDNSGMDMLVLFVQMERLGIPTLKHANAQFLLHGMELLALHVLEEEFIITLLINVNAQVVKLTMDMYVQ